MAESVFEENLPDEMDKLELSVFGCHDGDKMLEVEVEAAMTIC